MSLSLIALIAGGLVVIVLIAMVTGIFNKLVSYRNRYKNAFAQIEVQLKRRYDPIPNHAVARIARRKTCPMNTGTLLPLLTSGVVLFSACSQPASVDQDQMGRGANSFAVKTPTPAPETGFVYTADEKGNSVSVIDLGSGLVKTVGVSITPHNVQVSRDGRSLLVVGMRTGMKMSEHQAGETERTPEAMQRGRLLIFDAATMNADGAADIEVGRKPAHVIIDAQGQLAYVTNAEDNTLSVVDVAQRKVVGEIGSGTSPHGLRMSPDGREIYVANTGDDSVSVIDVAGLREVARIPVGKAPGQVGFTPDGRRVYVSSTTENIVVVVDTAQRKRIADIPVGRTPIQVFATPDGRYVYVGNEGTSENPDNRASVIDTATDQVIATVETGTGAHGVVVSDDGSRAFVANTIDGTVSVIDTANQKVTRNIKVGEGSGGITFRSVQQ
jgi:YVTN family beta-propeller protein